MVFYVVYRYNKRTNNFNNVVFDDKVSPFRLLRVRQVEGPNDGDVFRGRRRLAEKAAQSDININAVPHRVRAKHFINKECFLIWHLSRCFDAG